MRDRQIDWESKQMQSANLKFRLFSLFVFLSGLGIFIYNTIDFSEFVNSSKKESNKDDLSKIEQKWGIRVLGIHWTATGDMLDFGFQILDDEKVLPLLERKIKPYILVYKSGVTLHIPDSSGTTILRHAKMNQSFYILFSNPGRHVKIGDRVSLIIGDSEIKNLIIR